MKNESQAAAAGEYLREHAQEISDAVIALLWERFPWYGKVLGTEGRRKCRDDICYHLLYLSDSVAADSPRLFSEYVRWVKSLFDSIGVSNESFLESLRAMRMILLEDRERAGQAEEAEGEAAAAVKQEKQAATALLDSVITDFYSFSNEEKSHISRSQPLGRLAETYLNALLDRKRDKAVQLLLGAVEEGTDIRDLYEHVFQVSQWEIGRLWQNNKVSVAQEHYCTAVTQLVMSRLYPYIFNREKNGLVFLGTSVEDELHELGVRMIADFFELEGWDTYFLGSNTPSDTVVQTAVEEQADILGVSVTMTFHISKVRELIELIRSRTELQSTKVLVGGYPFLLEPDLWKKVGADGTALNARGAVQIANTMMKRDGRG